MRRRVSGLGLWVIGIASCSGGSGTPSGADATATMPPAGDGGVMNVADAAGPAVDAQPEPELVLPVYAGRIVVTPSALLFTKPGDHAALRAEAFDAQGKKIDVAVTWESSRPGDVTVDAQGSVAAVAALGSSQIRARAGTLVSAPVLALVAEPPAGAVLVSDAQIVAGPTPVDPTAEAGPGAKVSVTVDGLAAAPAPGTMVLGSEGKSVGGRVVSATPNAAAPGRLDLVLETVPLFDLFARLHLDGTYAVDGAAMAEALAMPAPTMALRPPRARRGPQPLFQLGEQKFKLGPLDCSGKLTGGALTGDATLKLVPSMNVDLHFWKDAADNWTDVLVKLEGGLTAMGTLTAKFSAAFGGSVGCKLEITKIPLPIAGPISAVIGFKAPIGFKGELTAQLMSVPLELGFTIKGSSKVKVGFKYTPQTGAEDLGDSQVTFKAEPILKLPQSTAPATLTLTAALGAYTGIDGGISLGLIGGASVSLLEANLLLRETAKLALIETQLEEPAYASSYDIKSVIEAGAGSDAKKILMWFGGLVVLKPLFSLESPPLARSPTGILIADKNDVSAGKSVTFTVMLEPETTTFLGISNISEVRIYEQAPGMEVKLVNTMAGGGASSTWTWTPTPNDVEGDYTFYAAVVTPLSPLLPLEVIEDSHVPVHLGARTGWHGTIGYSAVGHSSRDMMFMTGISTEMDNETHDSTGHETIMVAQSPLGDLEVTRSTGDWSEVSSSTQHVTREANACHYDGTGTTVIMLAGIASPPVVPPQLTFTGNSYEITIFAPSAMLSGSETYHSSQSVTGGCMNGPPVDMTTPLTGDAPMDNFTVDGMLDPAKPDAVKGKMDVMRDGVPPLTYSVSWDLTRN